MAKRLNVALQDQEYREIRRTARACKMTISAWVRQALRAAAWEEANVARKVAVIHKATQYNFVAPDIEKMLTEIDTEREGNPRQ